MLLIFFLTEQISWMFPLNFSAAVSIAADPWKKA